MTLESTSAVEANGGLLARRRLLPNLDVEIAEAKAFAGILCTCAVSSSQAAALLEETLGMPVPTEPGAVGSQRENGRALWWSPRSWLVICDPANETANLSALERAFDDGRVLASRFSDHFCWIELRGSNIQEVLCEGGFVSFDEDKISEDRAKQTQIAGLCVFLFTVARERWMLGIERSRARYFVDWLETLDQAHAQ